MSAVVFGLDNVNLTFGSEVIFHSVDLKVRAGESVVLVGPSGHGKTCLLKLMAGLLPPTSGAMRLGDVELYELGFRDRSIRTRRMGMLFQKNALFDSLSVFENVAFPLREVKNITDETRITKVVDELLEAVGLSHVSSLFPHEISGGMQKRLGIARALVLKPEIVFYDDPTAGLDPITSRQIVELILRLQQENGSTIVLVTNDMNRAFELSERIIMVVDKEIIETGNKEQTLLHEDPRVHQFVRGLTTGPLQVV